MKRIMIDPPSGWMYGFPKIIPFEDRGRAREWLVENGYPQEEIDKLGDNFYYRSWSIDERDDMEENKQIEHKQVIVVRKDLKMRLGKAIAQGAHASLKAILDLCEINNQNLTLNMDDRLEPWITGRFKKICVYVNDEKQLLEVYNQAKQAGLICSLIKDAGLTEFKGVPTYTTVAIGPDVGNKIDEITGNLPLL